MFDLKSDGVYLVITWYFMLKVVMIVLLEHKYLNVNGNWQEPLGVYKIIWKRSQVNQF